MCKLQQVFSGKSHIRVWLTCCGWTRWGHCMVTSTQTFLRELAWLGFACVMANWQPTSWPACKHQAVSSHTSRQQQTILLFLHVALAQYIYAGCTHLTCMLSVVTLTLLKNLTTVEHGETQSFHHTGPLQYSGGGENSDGANSDHRVGASDPIHLRKLARRAKSQSLPSIDSIGIKING